MDPVTSKEGYIAYNTQNNYKLFETCVLGTSAHALMPSGQSCLALTFLNDHRDVGSCQ